MSDQDTNIPDDDELLSAYLDDELTPDERARVEERLAADPTARQLLDQLRAVSQAVRDLPRETVGKDLRQAILERAKLAAAEQKDAADVRPAAQPLSDDIPWPTPELSIGRTVRGWVWAGLAVAAALLLMFLQPGSHKEADVPGTVAMRSESSGGDHDRGSNLRARDELSTREAETATASAAAPLRGGGGFGGARAEPAAVPATTPPTAGTPLANSSEPDSRPEVRREIMVRDQVAVSSPASGRASVSGRSSGELAADASQPSPAAPPAAAAEDQLVVVHVQVTPVAFQTKTFDGLLARNGIEVEEAPATNEQSAPEEEAVVARREASRLKDKAASTVAEPDLDVVFVSAPAAQVASCLADLDKDTHNYLAVDIDAEPPEPKAPAGKQGQVEEWKQYNRGTVPPDQKLRALARAQSADRRNRYYADDGDAYRSTVESNLSQLRQSTRSFDNRSRALRVQVEPAAPPTPSAGYGLSATDSLSSGVSTAKPPEVDAFGFEKKQLSEEFGRKLAENGENVQVLFFLCPNAPPAPSPGADNGVP